MRRVEDRRRHQRAVDAAVGDGEGAALHLLDRRACRRGRGLPKSAMRLLDLGDRELVGVAHHRHDEALVGADGDADVVVVLVDDVAAVDLGVDGRDLLQRLDAGLHEEAHEAELHAVLLLEHVLVLVAQLHHRAHVDVVERRQHGGGVLRVLQAPRDGLAQLRHPHALFARGVVRRRGRAGLDGRRRAPGAARRRRSRSRRACRPW